MKKILLSFLCLILVFSFTGCSNSNEESTQSESTRETTTEEAASSGTAADSGRQTDGKVLVAYFSWADNAVLDEDVDAVTSPSVIAPGNVEELAGWVQEETGGDLFSIRVTDPYPSDWDDCLERANEERGDDARPELEENVENLDDYDTVYLGYPNWLAYHKLIQCTQLA